MRKDESEGGGRERILENSLCELKTGKGLTEEQDTGSSATWRSQKKKKIKAKVDGRIFIASKSLLLFWYDIHFVTRYDTCGGHFRKVQLFCVIDPQTTVHH